MYYDRKINEILKDWKRAAKATRVIQYAFQDGVLTIYTSQPGWLIGKEGMLVNKYVEILKKEIPEFENIEIVETAYYWV